MPEYQSGKTNVILGDTVKCLWGKSYITDKIGDVTYQISPLSFFQVNPVQTQKLYGTALEYAGLTGEETVWDLYCGIGTISLFLAKHAKKVCGVEIVPQAIDDARENARLNRIENAEFLSVRPRRFCPNITPGTPKNIRGNGLMPTLLLLTRPERGAMKNFFSVWSGCRRSGSSMSAATRPL